MNAQSPSEPGPPRPTDIQEIQLVPLNCVRCATPVPAEGDEIGWVCGQCGQGLILDEAQGLASLEVQYAAAIQSRQGGQPFWTAEGRVTLDRDTYGRSQDRASREFWRHPRTFFVPAVELPLDMLLSLGTHLLHNPPELAPGAAVPFPPLTVSTEDLPSLVEFIIVAIEAERKDRLKEIHFDLQLGAPALWVLPGAEKAG